MNQCKVVKVFFDNLHRFALIGRFVHLLDVGRLSSSAVRQCDGCSSRRRARTSETIAIPIRAFGASSLPIRRRTAESRPNANTADWRPAKASGWRRGRRGGPSTRPSRRREGRGRRSSPARTPPAPSRPPSRWGRIRPSSTLDPSIS